MPLLITNNKVYNVLKFIALVLLPALGTLYFTFSQTWGWTNGREILGSITAVDTFLGVILHLSSQAYANKETTYDGRMEVTNSASKKSFSLNLFGDPMQLDKKDTVTFKVVKAKPTRIATKSS